MLCRVLRLGIVAAAVASAGTIDVSSQEFVEFRQGAELQYEFPYPDLQYLDNLPPVSLYWFIAGRQPLLPASSYQFSIRLESLDAANSVRLADATGTPTTLCLDGPFTCNVSEPGIIFIVQYSDAPGLSTLVGGNTVSGSPALWLFVRNEGPPITIGVPGVAFRGFGLTWGNALESGVDTPAVRRSWMMFRSQVPWHLSWHAFRP